MTAARFPNLRERTIELGVRIAKLCDALPKKRSATVIANQLIRCGTSVGAQYRESQRSRSDAEVISKLESVLQELDETAYWIQLLIGAGHLSERRLGALQKEVDELTAIFVTCVKKIKDRAD